MKEAVDVVVVVVRAGVVYHCQRCCSNEITEASRNMEQKKMVILRRESELDVRYSKYEAWPKWEIIT